MAPGDEVSTECLHRVSPPGSPLRDPVDFAEFIIMPSEGSLGKASVEPIGSACKVTFNYELHLFEHLGSRLMGARSPDRWACPECTRALVEQFVHRTAN